MRSCSIEKISRKRKIVWLMKQGKNQSKFENFSTRIPEMRVRKEQGIWKRVNIAVFVNELMKQAGLLGGHSFLPVAEMRAFLIFFGK